MFALVDCNSFYASCERVFRPDLKSKPIVVLSNNDGCVVALTKEAKEMGIKMCDPWFEIEKEYTKKGGVVFSSNYELYADISSIAWIFTILGLIVSKKYLNGLECQSELE